MTETEFLPDTSLIVDMAADGTILSEPSPPITPDAVLRPDPPGIRKAFKGSDDHALNAQLQELRARDLELSAHEGHTREAQHARVDERAQWAKGRVDVLDRDFAVTLDRNPDAYPSPGHATVRMMAAPAWAKALHAAVDAKPESDPGVRPTHEQVSGYTASKLSATRTKLRAEISELEHELKMRARRRDTYRAQQAEREAEASHPTREDT